MAAPKTKYFHKFAKALPEQQGKVVVITGTTSGTGFIAARTSLSKGATIVMLNRNSARAEEAVKKLNEAVPGSEDRLKWIPCDLQDFESVEKAAEEVKSMFPEGIDVLCNNAGIMAVKDRATKDGYDVQMQTNHLSHFLLTKELYPLLQKGAEKNGDARVVNHTSICRLMPFTTLKEKFFEKRGGNLGGNGGSMYFGGGSWERYHQSKLANSVFTLELAKRLTKSGSKVRTICGHPGFSATELQVTSRKEGGFTGSMSGAQSPEDGTMGILRGMFSKDVENGALYGPFMTSGPANKRWHGWLSSAAAGRRLWKKSEEACGQFKI